MPAHWKKLQALALEEVEATLADLPAPLRERAKQSTRTKSTPLTCTNSVTTWDWTRTTCSSAAWNRSAGFQHGAPPPLTPWRDPAPPCPPPQDWPGASPSI